MGLRQENIKKLQQDGVVFDSLVIGAGINGAVSAAALSAKGAKVALIDKGDFACFSSSQSSNLTWGGIKYLENYEFFLVDKLCKSRNQLMQYYPSTVKEIRFLTSIEKGFRFPAWLVYASTVFYWGLGRFFTKAPEYVPLKKLKKIAPYINTKCTAGAVEYSDAYLFDNDARFVFNFVQRAMEHGCVAANYVGSTQVKKEKGLWVVHAYDSISRQTLTVRAKTLVNACGAYVDEHNQLTKQVTEHRHIFSKGVHLIIDKVSHQHRVLTFFASDGRLFFMIPMGNRTMVGTTDTPVDKPEVVVNEQDREFILSNVNRLLSLEKPITRDDIIAERCGVRPLAIAAENTTDWLQLSRKHVIEADTFERHLSIFGGKTTDCLNVAEEVTQWVQKMGVLLPAEKTVWYGEDPHQQRQEFLSYAQRIQLEQYCKQDATETLTDRLWRRYGGAAITLLKLIEKDAEQAQVILPGTEFLRCEIGYIAQTELIVTFEDFLRRRTKIAQIMCKKEIVAEQAFKEVCAILFAEQSAEKWQQYAQEQ